MSPASPVFYSVDIVRLSLNSTENKTPSLESKMSMLVRSSTSAPFIDPSSTSAPSSTPAILVPEVDEVGKI